MRDDAGNIVVKGTDDMSAGELMDYNRDRLTHPDVSAESFAAVKDDVANNLKSAAGDIPQVLENASAVGTANALSGG